ncbi:gamma-aminobutyric acid receptor subunit epsilon [Sorex fumeus]|uniref:gamma-aminobutyric acid receptor subunit epsilon n=1 Tax=Sorex fumeus TaxID=62283 RepID=UPI0024ACD31C|nr:gamma-aminobutyric acid receptor subunit epsilon [Sorex fumeus]
MLAKVVRVLLLLTMILTAGIKAPHITSKIEPTAPNIVYGPMPKPPEEKKTSPEKKESYDFTPVINKRMSEATRILDNMLANYDSSLRPGIGKEPTVVNFTFIIHSFGPLSVVNMEYTIDATFHQTWYDERLSFNGSFEDLLLNRHLVNQLWLPNIDIKNSKRIQDQGHDMNTRMARIYKNGKVLHTTRMIIDIGCPMQLNKFPLDSHSCPLSFSSFFYPNSEVIFKWNKLDFNTTAAWKLFEFELQGVTNTTEITDTEIGEYTVMTFYFHITRQLGFLTIHRYIPCSLSTMLSWLSFWIHKDFSSARISLGITAILTLSTISSLIKRKVPNMTCGTVLDFYVATCFVFSFCSLLEFALITLVTYKRNKLHVPKIRHSRSFVRVHISARDSAYLRARARAATRLHLEGLLMDSDSSDTEGEEQQRVEEWVEGGWERLACPRQVADYPDIAHRPASSCKWYQKFFCTFASCRGGIWQDGRIYIHVYRLDAYSRIWFPLVFVIFNIVYWSGSDFSLRGAYQLLFSYRHLLRILGSKRMAREDQDL